VSQVERLKEDLEHERKMRKQLAAQISSLLKQVSTLSQMVTALTEELREAKKQNNTSTVKQNPPAPEDPANHEAIKSLIESILGPALKSLNAPAPQLKRAAKQKQTKAEIPQAPAQEPITPTASTSKDSYSQAVRTTPKAKTIEDALEDIVVAGAPEVTPMTTDPETTATEPKPASAETLKPSATGSQEPGLPSAGQKGGRTLGRQLRSGNRLKGSRRKKTQLRKKKGRWRNASASPPLSDTIPQQSCCYPITQLQMSCKGFKICQRQTCNN